MFCGDGTSDKRISHFFFHLICKGNLKLNIVLVLAGCFNCDWHTSVFWRETSFRKREEVTMQNNQQQFLSSSPPHHPLTSTVGERESEKYRLRSLKCFFFFYWGSISELIAALVGKHSHALLMVISFFLVSVAFWTLPFSGHQVISSCFFDVSVFKMVSSWKRTPHKHVVEGNVYLKHVSACVRSVVRSGWGFFCFCFGQQKRV